MIILLIIIVVLIILTTPKTKIKTKGKRGEETIANKLMNIRRI